MFKFFKAYLGDYSPLLLDHGAYEVALHVAGAESGTQLYDKCIEVIDSLWPEGTEVKILDLACGGGAFGKACKDRNKSYIIDGLDLYVPEKEQLMAAGIYRRLEEADILTVDFLEQYDIVVSNQFFEHLYPKDALDLLVKVSHKYAKVLISVPLPYHTFAYSKDYLLGSLKEDGELSEQTLQIALAAVHKCYFTPKLMAELGFHTQNVPVYFSNFFLKTSSTERMSTPLAGLLSQYSPVSDAELEKELAAFYRKRHASLPRPKNRRLYEKALMHALLLEPKQYKILRRCIYFLTQIPRKLKRRFVVF